MTKVRAISVIGLGKLGLCTAVCFAAKGYRVRGVDIDAEKISQINKGISPIEETDLALFLKKAKGRLSASSDYDSSVLNSEVTFVVVATPSLADGSFSNEHLESALTKIGESLKKKKGYHLVVITSTVMPRTVETVAKFLLEKTSGKKCGKDFGVAYNPEFIALGSVIHDFLNPDFLLIGEMNEKDGDILEEIYKKTCDNAPRFARMSPINAEIAKISLNCYVTTKITFANSLAMVCEKIKGADAHVISNALGMDSRIGNKYIRPGLGFGGPCFPRDNRAFAALAGMLEGQAELARMVDKVNSEQPVRVFNKINSVLGTLKKKKEEARIALLGLSYKANTPIIEDSQALNIAQLLVNEGCKVIVFDPQAMPNSKGVLGNSVVYAKNAQDCISSADIAVLAVPWEEFKKIDFKKAGKSFVLIDCWKYFSNLKNIKIEYLGKG